ncbi:MAG: hypothetical protein ACR2P4_06640 [Gammaproteobacteria bacterium]
MGGIVYFLPVRGHLGRAELMAAFSAQNGKTELITAKTAADIKEQNAPMAAVVVILTYADMDIIAARELLNALPACGGGVFCLVVQVPEGAPFLPKLRERANALQNDKNPVVIMEMPAALRQYDEAAKTLREMISDNNSDNISADDESPASAYNQTPEAAVRSAHLAVKDLL